MSQAENGADQDDHFFDSLEEHDDASMNSRGRDSDED
jgi:hypothetical protein